MSFKIASGFPLADASDASSSAYRGLPRLPVPENVYKTHNYSTLWLPDVRMPSRTNLSRLSTLSHVWIVGYAKKCPNGIYGVSPVCVRFDSGVSMVVMG